MNKKIVIRSETDADVSAITEVTVAAFKTLEVSNHTEQFVIAALRAAKALSVSLVAEVDGRVIGHIAFSPVTISDGTANWYGLGPVSVLPAYQRQGIGKALIREGLVRLKDMDAQGCCLVGHPDYYTKFGFKNMTGLGHVGVPQEIFFALSFCGDTPQGTVAFHEGFKADGREEGGRERLYSSPGPSTYWEYAGNMIERSQGKYTGRNKASAYKELVWTVAIAEDVSDAIEGQTKSALQIVDVNLRGLGTDRTRIVSAQVFLANISDKPIMDKVWCDWIGDDPRNWPQRSCLGVDLGGDVLIEIVVMAVRPYTADRAAGSLPSKNSRAG